MNLVNTAHGQAKVEWSEEATVFPYWSAFQRNSYAARVEFPDGRACVIACPDNARRERTDFWLHQVVEAAVECYKTGRVSAEV
jgi:hypothetical protein